MYSLQGILLVVVVFPLASQSASIERRAITCLRVGTTATATWINSAGRTCTFTGIVGSNYGASSSGSGEYVSRFPKKASDWIGLTDYVAIRVTAAAEPDAQAPRLEMSIPRIASLTTFALTLTVQVEELGMN
jgi:hypothetical protein